MGRHLEGRLLRSHRDEVFRRLGENYWRLDPYIRARNISDRTGVIQEGGKLDYYPLGEKLIRAKAKPKILAWNVNGMNLSTVTTINGRRV
ncbi:CRAL/TRIO domain protein [Penicillium chermesinum]|uniref:CRAL/TRIO domain protein n=1 Tax=Penicillium chermesinum TaxID=63820 RepID=A0A9W9NHB6_9EURO|nr:CRAL/TRIO domain protein [Penicillium chermesinum]KAJ5220019.1 CRAL/TRIO domain protein [Penicillium chermesinum]